jgi:hypothetical protein
MWDLGVRSDLLQYQDTPFSFGLNGKEAISSDTNSGPIPTAKRSVSYFRIFSFVAGLTAA